MLTTALLLGCVVVSLAGVVVRVGRLIAGGAPVRADELVVGVCAAVSLGILGWLLLTAVAVALAGVPGHVGRAAGVLAGALAPAVLRRAVSAVLGLTLAAAVAPGGSVAAATSSAVGVLDRPDPSFRPLPDPGWGPGGGGVAAAATEGATIGTATVADGIDAVGVVAVSIVGGGALGRAGGGGPDDELPHPTAAPDPGWVPTTPLVRPQPDLRVLGPARPPSAPTERVEVVVHRGDTLWSIAARHLGPDPADAEVAAAWPHWFAANRDVVGDDPDLLLPGQVLRVPEGVPS